LRRANITSFTISWVLILSAKRMHKEFTLLCGRPMPNKFPLSAILTIGIERLIRWDEDLMIPEYGSYAFPIGWKVGVTNTIVRDDMARMWQMATPARMLGESRRVVHHDVPT